MRITEQAHAKVNLVLRVGAPRADGLHPLCSIFASLDLADRVTMEPARQDAVACAGVEGPNLASAAIRLYRETVPDLPPVRVAIEKRIPVAAGLGGGSADAAAVLRAADELSGAQLGVERLRALAADIGSDVPSQVVACHALVAGVGEVVEPVALPSMSLVLLPSSQGLSTPSVYGELDRLRRGSPPPPASHLDPEALRERAEAGLDGLAVGLENDLAQAAISLRPELAERVDLLLAAGAMAAQITGSGPTVFGVFGDRKSADAAAARLEDAIVTNVRRC